MCNPFVYRDAPRCRKVPGAAQRPSAEQPERELVDAKWIDQAALSEAAAAAGLGSVVWVSRVKDRGKAIWYLLGYVFKSLGVDDERSRGWRKLTVSRIFCVSKAA